MQTGTKISGVAHLVLVGVAIFGGAFKSDPLPFEVHEVSVISAEQFAAMTASRPAPDVAAEPVAPDALTRPDPETDTPEVTTEADKTPDKALPEPTAQPVPDPEPESRPVPPTPETEAAPTLEQPQPEVVIQPQEISPRPQPRPVDRVAPVPVAAPPPDAAPDEVETPQVNPDEGAEAPQEPAKATAPEEASDRIVTEADEKPASLAPTSSVRPPTRPANRPKPPSDSQSATSNAVNDAVTEALGGAAPAAPAPTGPPLTGGEKDALRVAVSTCWNVGSLSSAALQTTVVVGVSMTPTGKPQSGTIRLLSSSGGPEAAAKQAFEAARRAIIRCGAKGYDLPAEKYGQWQEIEMTFNPERMRIK